jgi:hypothetical protein
VKLNKTWGCSSIVGSVDQRLIKVNSQKKKVDKGMDSIPRISKKDLFLFVSRGETKLLLNNIYDKTKYKWGEGGGVAQLVEL